jgi:CRISPR/Cas system-associated endoribonuclease Cas2
MQLAAKADVSERTVANAATVTKHGTPELQASVLDGTIEAKPAAKLARQPAEVQRKAVNEAKAKKAAKMAARSAPILGRRLVDSDESEQPAF